MTSGRSTPTGWRSDRGRCSARFGIAVLVVTLLSTAIVLIPIAVWLAVRWSLIVPAIELEGRVAFEGAAAERVSCAALAEGRLAHVAGAAIAVVAGPLVGAS